MYYLMIFLSSTCGENKEKIDCLSLERAIQSYEFINYFSVCENKSIILSVIDTNYYFKNCTLSNTCERITKLSRKFPQNADINIGSSPENVNDIILYRIDKDQNEYNLYFWQPYSNRTLKFNFKKNKEDFIIGDIYKGNF